MEQVAEKLKTGGHHAAIGEANLPAAQTGKDQPGAIRLEILPAGARRECYEKHQLPGVTFSAEPGMKVGVYSRSGRPDEDQGAGPQRRFRRARLRPRWSRRRSSRCCENVVTPAGRKRRQLGLSAARAER